MFTIIETPTFEADARKIWPEEERSAFFAWLAANPEIGDAIPGSGGCRKVRWSVAGSGKRGGVRVIYFTRLANGEIWLLVIYKKAVKDNIPAHILKSIREVLEND
ncbi:mRNA-degrading endonuclease RelE, toxin component of the RelBE toxin-antitoxin system [Marinobacter antarcticus]|uniref:mRNA-degrading endonuclease RelE, toxin component of the RelBE toxin-antitoxin system n=1 Tax=Marinobacter antarcticus TaxID=564117 RepID=A0A1M6Q130_9GAMM|nr:transcriptional regulator [Marinobacter antarcticus]SHK13796.1 mRNA-degrading endonuclease RelE, toxin component of the RelBE toxin-antitoxin system [Marinobacter antarcticus]